LHSGRNYEQIKFGECLLPFCSECFVFLSKNLKIKTNETIILSVACYGCQTWSLTLREEHRLRVFENKVVRRISGLKREEVAGD